MRREEANAHSSLLCHLYLLSPSNTSEMKSRRNPPPSPSRPCPRMFVTPCHAGIVLLRLTVRQADDTLRGFLEHLLDKSPEMRLSVTEALGHPWIRMRLLVGAGEKAFLPSAGDVGDPGGVSRDVDDGIKDARTTAATNSAITERAGDQGGRSSWW